MGKFQSLIELLHKQSPQQDSHDAWRWGLGNNAVFSVKSYYGKLQNRKEVAFPNSSIRILKAPRKVCFFTWLAARRVILTAENLRNTKIAYVSWCFMCKGSGKVLITP